MANAGQFKPGQSGNPGGRPKKIPAFVAKFRALEPKMLERLTEIISGKGTDGKNSKLKPTVGELLKAIEIGYAYSRGKPRQAVELSGDGGGPVQFSGVIVAPAGVSLEDWTKAATANSTAIDASIAKVGS